MPTLQIQEQVELAPYTTLGVGGPARFFVHIRSEDELTEALEFAQRNHLPVFALGGGSNLLVHDEGFPGLVLHLELTGAPVVSLIGKKAEYRVPAGMVWDDLVLETCRAGMSGMECLAGVPGLTGGTPVQNVGAYGQEVAQTIRSVRAFDLKTSSFTTLSREQCRLRYRGSLFNTEARGRYLVCAASFHLERDGRPNLTYADLTRHFGDRRPEPMEVYHAVREIRARKGMLLTPGDADARSAGSFFKNPVVPRERLEAISAAERIERSAIPHWPAPDSHGEKGQVKLAAAWLVEQAGFGKGFALGRAGISSRHSLALINRGGATFADIARLREVIRSAVSERFGVLLEQEPIELGPATQT